jgi:hypothetical protein
VREQHAGHQPKQNEDKGHAQGNDYPDDQLFTTPARYPRGLTN